MATEEDEEDEGDKRKQRKLTSTPLSKGRELWRTKKKIENITPLESPWIQKGNLRLGQVIHLHFSPYVPERGGNECQPNEGRCILQTVSAYPALTWCTCPAYNSNNSSHLFPFSRFVSVIEYRVWMGLSLKKKQCR